MTLTNPKTTLVDRPLAGPGNPGTVFDMLATAGWEFTDDDRGNGYAFPADRRVVVAFVPETNTFAPDHPHQSDGGPLWVVRTYDDLHRQVWEATFGPKTPAELVAAFVTDLATGGPLDPERGQD